VGLHGRTLNQPDTKGNRESALGPMHFELIRTSRPLAPTEKRDVWISGSWLLP